MDDAYSKEYYARLRSKLNRIHKELQEMPDEYKVEIKPHVGSILNGYREGDISFSEACSLLELREEKYDIPTKKLHRAKRKNQRSGTVAKIKQ